MAKANAASNLQQVIKSKRWDMQYKRYSKILRFGCYGDDSIGAALCTTLSMKNVRMHLVYYFPLYLGQ